MHSAIIYGSYEMVQKHESLHVSNRGCHNQKLNILGIFHLRMIRSKFDPTFVNLVINLTETKLHRGDSIHYLCFITVFKPETTFR